MSIQKIEKVLLISLPAILEEGALENSYNISHAFNLGLAYLAGMVRKNNIQVEILDCLVEDPSNVRSVEDKWREVGLSNEQIIEQIGKFNPDLIGIAIPFSYQHHMAMKLAATIKLTFPELTLVAGRSSRSDRLQLHRLFDHRRGRICTFAFDSCFE
jgi:hypothetical protein